MVQPVGINGASPVRLAAIVAALSIALFLVPVDNADPAPRRVPPPANKLFRWVESHAAVSRGASPGALAMLGSTVTPARVRSARPRTITTVAAAEFGDNGPATEASVAGVQDVLVAANGDVFFSDLNYHVIRRIDDETGIITSVAGNGFSGDGPDLVGSPTDVALGWPFGMTFDEDENLIFADFTNHELRFVNLNAVEVTAFGVTISPGAMATIAGDGFKDENGLGRFTGDGGPATEASLNFPRGMVLDDEGNLFFDDIDNLRVRRIDRQTGIITTVAGDGSFDLEHSGDDGPATEASVHFPTSVTFDETGNLYVAEFTGRIRKVDESGIITTIAGTAMLENAFGGDGGPATEALIGQNPKALTFDETGNLLFCDQNNNRIRRIDATTGIITTVAGPGNPNVFGDFGFSIADDGVHPTLADMAPAGLAFGDDRLLVTDEYNGLLWSIDPGPDGLVDADPTEQITRLISGGVLKLPTWFVVDPAGDFLVSLGNRNGIVKVDRAGGVTPLVGTGVFPLSIDGRGGDPRDDLGDGGPASGATVGPFVGISLGRGGDLFIADWASRRIRRADALPDPAGGVPQVTADSPIDTVKRLRFLSDALLVAGPRRIYLNDPFHHRIWRLDPRTGTRRLVAGSGRGGNSGDGGPATKARLGCPAAFALDRAGKHLYFSDACKGVVRTINLETGTINTAVELDAPSGISEPLGLDVLGNRFLFVVDVFARSVVRVDLRSDTPSPTLVAGIPYVFTPGFTGDDVPATTAELDNPVGLALDGAGKLYVTEEWGQRIRRIGLVDIRPGSFPNRVALGARGTLLVAILGTAGVAAEDIDPSSIRVAGAAIAGGTHGELEDVDNDGRVDLVVKIRIRSLQLSSSDFEARVVARTFNGARIRDADWITPSG